MPVLNFQHGSPAVLTVTSGKSRLGSIQVGDVGPSGDSGAPGALLPSTPEHQLPGGDGRTITLTAQRAPVDLDAVMVQPALLELSHQGGGLSGQLIANDSPRPRATRLTEPFPAPSRSTTGGDPQGSSLACHARNIVLEAGQYAIVSAPASQ